MQSQIFRTPAGSMICFNHVKDEDEGAKLAGLQRRKTSTLKKVVVRPHS